MMKYSPYGNAVARIAGITVVSLFSLEWCRICGFAVGTFRFIIPSYIFKVGNTIFFGGEKLINFNYVHNNVLLYSLPSIGTF